MASLTKISIFAIACFVFGVAQAEVKTLQKNLDFPDELLYFNTDNLNFNNQEQEGLTYALCKTLKEGSSSRLANIRCKIVILSQTLSEKSCNISLKTANYMTFNEQSRLIRLINFGLEKVALLWVEDQWLGNIKCRIIDMATCNEIKEVALMEDSIAVFKLAESSLIRNEDSFSVIIQQLTTSRVPAWSIFSIDSKGEIISHQQNWTYVDWLSDFTSIAPNSKSKGYLQFNYHSYKNEVFLIKSNGLRYQLIREGQSTSTNTGISTLNDTVSIAFVVKNKTAKIWRFDREGNTKSKVSLDFDYTIANLQVHNVADGGFLLLTAKTAKEYENYQVTKVDATGKRIGQLKFTRPKDFGNKFIQRRYSEAIAFKNNASNGYCLSSVISPTIFDGQLMHSSHNLYLFIKCFSNNDFFAVSNNSPLL